MLLLLCIIKIILKSFLPFCYILLELFVILEHFHDSFHVWLAVGRLVVFTFHNLLDLIGIIPVFVLHEEAQVDEY